MADYPIYPGYPAAPGKLPNPGAAGSFLGGAGGPLMMAAGAGLDIGGAIIGANSANQSANRQWQLIQSELARRNGIQSGLAPGLMTSAGITDPTARASMVNAISGQSVGEGGAGAQQPTQNPNHMLPGRTHTNANDIVNKVENPFGQAMANIAQGNGSLNDLKAAYTAYLQGIQNFTSNGGANARVAQQSLTNPKLMATFRALWQGLGGGQAPLLGQAA